MILVKKLIYLNGVGDVTVCRRAAGVPRAPDGRGRTTRGAAAQGAAARLAAGAARRARAGRCARAGLLAGHLPREQAARGAGVLQGGGDDAPPGQSLGRRGGRRQQKVSS